MSDVMEYNRKTVGYVMLLTIIVAGMFMALVGQTNQQSKQITELEKKVEKLRLQNATKDNKDLLPLVENIINVLSNQTQSIKDLKNIVGIEFAPAVENSCTNGVDFRGVDIIDDLKDLSWVIKRHPEYILATMMGTVGACEYYKYGSHK